MFELISSGIGLTIWLVTTFFFPILAGVWAKSKGYSFWLGALLGLFLNFIGLIIVWILPRQRAGAR